jgi:hypothetical protein
MKITIEVPDEHINGALAAPRARCWASAASWDPEAKQGHVVDSLDDGTIYEIDEGSLRAGLIQMASKDPDVFARVLSGSYDAVTGDALLQFMAFGELRYG